MTGPLRVPNGALIIPPDLFPLIHYAITLAQHARRRDGLTPSRRLDALDQLVTAGGQSDTPPAPPADAELVTVEDAAQLLGASPRTIRRRAPELGGRLVGGRWLLDRVAVEEHQEGTRQ